MSESTPESACPVNAKEMRYTHWWDKPIKGDYVMLMGFLMLGWGVYTKEWWYTFGGFLLFFMGVLAIPTKHEESGLHGEGGET